MSTSLIASNEIFANDSTDQQGTQYDSVVATLSSGKFVTVWASSLADGSGYSIVGRRFNADGSYAGGQFRTNVYASGDQIAPMILPNQNDDGFSVWWQSNGQDGSGYGVYRRRYDASGAAVDTSEKKVNTYTNSHQDQVAVANLADGNSVAVWSSYGQGGQGVSIIGRRYDPNGTALATEFRVSVQNNPYTAFYSAQPMVAGLKGGGFVVVWESFGSGGTASTDRNISMQVYNAGGGKSGSEVVINTPSTAAQRLPMITALEDGGYVTAWLSPNGSGNAIIARIYDADGTERTNQFRVNDWVVNGGTQPSVTALKDGNFLVMWTSNGEDGSSNGIFARRYDANGVRIGEEFQVNQTAAGVQQLAWATARDDGGFTVTWTTPDGSDSGIATRVFSASDLAPVVTGRDVETAAGGVLEGAALVYAGDAQGNYGIQSGHQIVTTYEFRDPGTDGGYFTVDGVAQTSGTIITVDAADIGTVSYVAGADAGVESFDVRASDGQTWSDWSTGSVTTLQALPFALPGSEVRINTYQTNEQSDVHIAMLDGGGYVATWRSTGQDGSGDGIYGRRYAADGTALSGEFRINSWTSAEQYAPEIVATRNGGFAVFWQSSGDEDGDGHGIFAQRYDAQGVALSEERRINGTISGDQAQVSAARLNDDRLVVVYMSQKSGVGTSILGRIYDPDLQQFGGSEIVMGDAPAETTSQFGSAPDVAALVGGGFVVTWHTYNGSTSNLDVVMQRFDTDGNRLGSETVVHAADNRTQQASYVAGLNDGGYVVTWQSHDASGDVDAMARVFNADGTPRADQFRVSGTSVGNQGPSDVIALANGDFLIAFVSPDESGVGAYARRFATDGTPVGDEFQLALTTAGDQRAPHLAARPDGGFIATFHSADSSDLGVWIRAWNGSVAPLDTVIMGTEGDDALTGDTTADRVVGLGGNDLLSGGDGDDLLEGGAGADTLDGGVGADTMFGGLGDDTYVVDDAGDVVAEQSGEGTDTVQTTLAAYALGSDVENLTHTGSSDFTGTGNGLDNILTGGAGNDTLSGGSGNDTLDGGGGADTLIGGAGDDTYVVDDAGDGVVENTGEGTDTVLTDLATYALPANVENLEYTGSGDFSGTGNGLDNTITGGSGNDTLDGGLGTDTLIGGVGNDTYVVGDAGDSVVESAGEGTDTVLTDLTTYTLPENVEHLTYTGSGNFTGTGNGSANTLTGGAGSDTLSGLGGNDWLDGGAGTDSLIGGTGNDTYVVDDAGDVVIENAGEGTDTVRTSLNTYTLPDNVENVVFTGSGDFAVTGNDQNNSLTGGSGQDTLIGLAGNDTLNGGSGADSMIGGTGNDTYTVDDVGDVVSELPGEGTDTVRTGLGTYTLGDDVENLTHTGSSPFTGTGNELDNSLTGGSGVDTLFGLDGNDTLNGGSGADSLIGGTGDDTYIVDNAGDVVTELSGEGADTVKSGITYTLPENVENLILTGSNDIDGTGNGLDNTITGNGGANTLDGDTGADTLIGGAGDDTYIVDDAGDLVTENAGQGFDELRTDLSSYTLPANVEKLTYTGTGDFAGTGNGLDNVLNGAGGNDTLSGGDGDDTLSGGAGADVLDGGNGSDTADYATSGQAVAVDLGAGTASGGDAAGDTLTSIENLTGSAHDDVLTGDGGDNVLIGGAGADTLTGGGGTDTAGYAPSTSGVVVDLASGAGTAGDAAGDVLSGIENLTGGAYDDVLRGDGGANLLDGGAGNDTLEGRGGDDTLIGGSGTDTAVFSGNVADYLATDDGGTWTFTDPVGGDGTDTLIGVERVQFADRLIYLDGTNNAPIVSENLSETTDEDAAPLAIDLLQGAWDFDGDAVSVTGLTQTAGWSVTATLVGGVLTIDPGQLNAMALGESETLVFTYGVTDGTDATTRTLSVTVEGRNDAPTVAAVLSASTDEDAGVVNLNLLQGADDVDNGASLSVTGLTQTGGASVGVTLAGGVMTFDPDQLTGLGVGESEVLTFAYDVTDGTASTPQTLTVTVDGRNDAPTAGDDVVYALYDTPLTLAAAVLLYNDTDPDASDSPSITSVGNAAHGTVSIDVDGNVVFTADTGFSGQASFEYTVTDGHGGTDTATVTVAVASQSAGGTALVAEATRQINFSYPNADVQALPFTAQLASGEIVAVWARRNDGSGDGIQGQRFAEDGTPIGSHFAIATNTSLDQLRPNIAALPDGGFLVTWESVHSGEYNIRMQRFDSSFAKVGGEQLVNTYIPSNQNYSEVTVLADDGWVVQWGSNAQDGSGWGVYQQRYDATGAKLGGEERVNSYVNNTQDLPRTAALDDGGWVTVWRSNGQDGSSWGAYQQRFAADGSRVGGETLINDVTADTQNTPVVAALSGGRWLVTWASNGADADLSGVVGKIFAADGTVEKSEFLINGISDANQVLNDVATLADGGFVVVWASGDYAGYNQGQIHGQRYDANGDKVGETFRIDDFPAMASHPTVTALDNGGFTVSWHTRHSTSTFDTDIYMRVFSPTTATPEVVSRDGYVAVGGAVSATEMVSMGHPQGAAFVESGLHPKTLFEFEDASATDSSGYLTLDGLRWAANTPLRIAAGDLDRVGWNGGAALGEQTFRVRGYDGTEWSDWAEGSMRTVGSLDTVHAVNGQQQVNFQIANGDSQDVPSLAQLADGTTLAVWSRRNDGSGSGVLAQRFAADGTPIGGHFTFATTTTGNQLRPSVAALADGGFVINWESDHSGDWNVRQQRYDAAFQKVGGEQLVNTYTSSSQNYAMNTALADGGWLVTWGSNSQDGSSWGVYQQRYASSGAKVGGETRVNTHTADLQYNQQVAALADGGWLVTWASNGQDGSYIGVYQRRYAADGSAVGGEQLVNQNTSDSQHQPRVAVLADGGWVVSWNSSGQDMSGNGAYARVFNADGSSRTDEFRLSQSGDGNQYLPGVAALDDGGFVAVWSQGNPIASSAAGVAEVHGRRFDADGVAIGEEFRIDQTAGSTDMANVFAVDGGFQVMWQNWNGADTYSTNVYSRFYTTDAVPMDVQVGTDGADVLFGSNGADTLTGGLGADVFHFESPDVGLDVITDFQAGIDVIEVVSANFDDLAVGQLDASRFALGTVADADTRFVFDTATKVLSYDADGTGAGAAVGLASLNVSTLSNVNIVVVS